MSDIQGNNRTTQNSSGGTSRGAQGSRPRRTPKGLVVLIVLGVALIVCALAILGRNVLVSREAGSASSDTLVELSSAIEARAESASSSSAAIVWQLDREMPTIEIDGLEYIGIISVPSLNIELPVLASWDADALATSACVYSGSYYTDDLVIGGYNYSSQFGALLGAEIGADVYLTNVDGRRIHYLISNRETLRSTAVDDLTDNRQNSESPSDWDLTLFTSDLSGSTPTAVRCVRQ